MRAGKILLLTALLLFAGSCWSGAATITVTTTIQAAINSASDGDVIKIPAGDFNEKIIINGFEKLTITGAGQDLTNIVGTGLAGALVTIANSSKITFKNCTVNGIGVITHNILLSLVKNAAITNCTVKNAIENGVYSLLSTGVTIKSCLIIQNTIAGINYEQTYSSNIISSVFQINSIGIVISQSKNIQVAKNTIMDNSRGLINDSSETTVVKQNTITNSSFAGIIDASASGFGNMYIKNQIKENPGDGVDVLAGLPTFSGNLIADNGGYGIRSRVGAYSTLIKNTISGNTNHGVYLENSSGYFSKNNITGNFAGVYQDLTSPSLYSLILTLTSNKLTANPNGGAVVIDNTGESILDARKNFAASNVAAGIVFNGGQSAFMDKNKVASNSSAGMGTGTVTPLTMTQNLVYDNGIMGISGGTSSAIYHNKVLANGATGIGNFDNSHLDGNTVQGNLGNGIDASGSALSMIENCKVLGNGDGVATFDLYDNAADDIWYNNKFGTASP